MEDYDYNSYYALVWSTTLKQDVEIKGNLICRQTVLPKDPRMLYGTTSKDVLKVTNIEFDTKVKYDVLTTKQIVKFVPIFQKVEVPRDVRIIVWHGSDTLEMANDYYKIMTPVDFENLVQHANVNRENELTLEASAKENTLLQWCEEFAKRKLHSL